MPENDCPGGCLEEINLEFVEREATPRLLMKLSIQLHLAGLSLSNTVSFLEVFGVERVRSTVHPTLNVANRKTAPAPIRIITKSRSVDDSRLNTTDYRLLNSKRYRREWTRGDLNTQLKSQGGARVCVTMRNHRFVSSSWRRRTAIFSCWVRTS
jgi:hypothetical protein